MRANCLTDCRSVSIVYKKAMADPQKDMLEAKSHIVMKVDAPPEEHAARTTQEMQNNVDNSPETTSHKSKLNTPVFGNANSFTMRSGVLGQPKLSSGFVLRPSQLGSKVENKPHTFALSPSRFNPFARTSDTDIENGQANSKETNGSTDETTNGSRPAVEPPKFVPLAVTESSIQCTSTNSVSSTPNFVFGQNLHERIVAENEKTSEAGASDTQPSTSSNHANANGTSELLFSSAVKSAPTTTEKEVKSLSESAREYEESRAIKRKYEEVTVVTGEEDEKNILQINCKLFTFDKATSNWQERGRGTLRLNDKEAQGQKYPHSRLVFRTSGSLRVVLNTKIWAEMTIDLASSKSLRITGMDNSGQIKVFLLMANPDEIRQLHRLLETRVSNEVVRQQQQKNDEKMEPDSTTTEPEVKKQAVSENTPDQQH